MAQLRRTGVYLHSGNPESKARTPRTGGRDVKSAGVWDPEGNKESGPKANPKTGKSLVQRAKGKKAGTACGWCGGSAKKPQNGAPARCGRCKRLEDKIADAARFLGAHGLRPLGASLDSESTDEAHHRESAAAARRELNAAWKRPTKAKRPRPEPKSAGKKTKGASSQRTSPKEAANANHSKIRNTRTPTVTHKLAKLRARINDEKRRGALDTAAGRARVNQLEAAYRRIAVQAAITP
ncbi:hypothetical protein [Rhodococcus gannanensis]|uniref:NUMOD3 motif-containing protein n=1 Tax=Rhodococcus gannanensis TaxID=1960308 RepID=A0ABW4P0B5_9NOCA